MWLATRNSKDQRLNLDYLYSVEREFAIPIEKLWSAWTEAAALEAWYHPVGMSCVFGTTRSETRQGGIWSCAVQVPGRDSISYFFGKYSSVVQYVHFEHSMHYTESKENFEKMDFDTPSHKITVDFESCGQKSWAKFSQYGQAPEAQVELMKQGIESYFDSLENFLERN